MQNKEPKYKHDCNNCVYLDTLTDYGKEEVDLYICDTKSIIARYNSNESSYSSYPIKVLREVRTMVLDSDKDIKLFQYFFDALKIATERNLI